MTVYTKRDRRRMCDGRFGYRATNDYGSGDLPAPYAQGDVVYIPAGAPALERMRGMGPMFYVVVYGPSIGEDDEWYFRVSNGDTRSDRLHVIPGECDWMEGVELLDTADSEGLARRRQMLADGWEYTPRWDVLAERDLYRTALEAIRSGCGVECATHALDMADERNGVAR